MTPKISREFIVIIKFFIDAVENDDASILRKAFHLNFDDVGENIEAFWLR